MLRRKEVSPWTHHSPSLPLGFSIRGVTNHKLRNYVQRHLVLFWIRLAPLKSWRGGEVASESCCGPNFLRCSLHKQGSITQRRKDIGTKIDRQKKMAKEKRSQNETFLQDLAHSNDRLKIVISQKGLLKKITILFIPYDFVNSHCLHFVHFCNSQFCSLCAKRENP